MKRISAISLTLAILTIAWTTAIALPEGAVARLGKGRISGYDRAVQFSPDGKLLAVATSIGVYLYEAQTHEKVALLETNALVFSVAFSPDGSILASGNSDGAIRLWDVSTGQLIDTLTGHRHTTGVYSVAFSPDGSTLASGSGDGTIKFWDVSTGQLIDTLIDPTYYTVSSVAFSPDGSFLVSIGSGYSPIWGRKIKLWDVSTRQLIDTFMGGHGDEIYSVAFSPDGSLLASGSLDRTIKLWDVSTRQQIATLTGHTHRVSSVAFSPDGSILASGSYDETIKFWDVSNRQLLDILTAHAGGVTSVAFSPDGSTLASGASYSSPGIKFWDVSTKQLIDTLTGYTSYVNSIAFSPDRSLLAGGSGYPDYTIGFWDVSTGQLIDTLTGHTSYVNSIAFSPNGSLLASGSSDETIRLWDVSTGQLIDTFIGHGNHVNSVAFSPNGSLLASGSVDQTIKLWDVSTGQLIDTLTGHTREVTCVAFSSDGSLLASSGGESASGFDPTIKLWDVSTGQLIDTLTGHAYSITSVAFSPDGSLLASGGEDRSIRLWDVSTRQLIDILIGHVYSVTSIAFSPDGSLLASGSVDRTVKLWDVSTRQLIDTLTGHGDLVTSVAFSSDGSLLASGSNDGTMLLWDMDGKPEPFDLALSARWNLISLPLSVQDSSVSTLFPDAISAFKFDNGYQQVTEMSVGVGYWVNLPSGGAYPIVGTPVDTLSLPLHSRWNLVGGISEYVPLSSIEQDPPNSIISVFRFENGYQQETEGLIPGVGYWMNASGECEIGLGGGVAKGVVLAEGREERFSSEAGWRVPVVMLSGGKVVEVVFGRDERGTAGIDGSLGEVELPPLPPSGMFDVRFVVEGTNGTYADILGRDSGEASYELRWQALEYPVVLSWEDAILPEGEMVVLSGPEEVDMRSVDRLVVEDVGIRSVVFRHIPSEAVPGEYSLLQNYPNPFNPRTTIRYALPEASDVVLRMYDASGRLVRVLSVGRRDAGHHVEVWDGLDERGSLVASGIYFYEIQAGAFRSVKRMVLLK